MRYKPRKDEFFFKKSSLACELYKGMSDDEEVMIYDRRSQRIILRVKPALVTLSHFMNLEPIKRKKK